MSLDRAYAEKLDAADPLAGYRDRFLLTDPALIYLNGNSLGALPLPTLRRMESMLRGEWGTALARSWDHWVDLPARAGDVVGELVGAASPTQLATIVATDPIYVNFNISEQDTLRAREQIRRLGLTPQDLKKVPVEVGLQGDEGYPYKGTLDYASPSINQATGTLAVRAILANPDRRLLPGFFVRVRIPDQQSKALLVPEAALGSDQGGRYLLVVGKDNVVEQRKVTIGPSVGDLRVIDKGLTADDRVVVDGILRAIPGEKVDPQMQSLSPPAP